MDANDIVRVESDIVGHREIPGDARYGVHALRASENFRRPRAQLLRDVPELCQALGMVKLAAQRANLRTGSLQPAIADAIGMAAEDLIADRHHLRHDLIVPLVQGGAGTSTNMNVNEVLANRALELLGRPAGDYQHCHPNDHVNRSQSTNDVYPVSCPRSPRRKATRSPLARRGWRRTPPRRCAQLLAAMPSRLTEIATSTENTKRRSTNAQAHRR
jgi:aspartate ammonia-lyase